MASSAAVLVGSRFSNPAMVPRINSAIPTTSVVSFEFVILMDARNVWKLPTMELSTASMFAMAPVGGGVIA